jgi:hypothetical protein
MRPTTLVRKSMKPDAPPQYPLPAAAFSPHARRLGVASGVAVALLSAVYAGVLSIGLLTLPSPAHQVQAPWLTLMELLIIAISPALVGLTVALHACVPQERKAVALASVAFMAMCAALTCTVHFCILTLSKQPAFAAGEQWARLVFSFQWPSVAYALDILAWDVFFPLGALLAATALPASTRTQTIRVLLFASAAFAFAGLAGVPLANMQVRNLGIIGYAILFPIAAALLAKLLYRAETGRAA